MTRIVSRIRIRRPIESVFDYVTTPANWPAWHPASRAVNTGADHPLRAARASPEDFVAAGRSGRATWRVTGHDAPVFWRIEARAPQGRATITYRLHSEDGETVFMRELHFAMGSALWALLDLVYARAWMERESAEALQVLKRLLERAAEPSAEHDQPCLAAG